jgi:hypothetical protein
LQIKHMFFADFTPVERNAFRREWGLETPRFPVEVIE